MNDLYHFASWSISTGNLSELAGVIYAGFLTVIELKSAL